LTDKQQLPLISAYLTSNGLIFTSGVVSREGDSEKQIRGCFEKLKGILNSAGTSMDRVLKATVYLADLSDRDKYLNPIWQEYFPVRRPCRTTIQATLGQDVRVEIEMVASLN